jgi:type IV secretory pathway TrbD component
MPPSDPQVLQALRLTRSIWISALICMLAGAVTAATITWAHQTQPMWDPTVLMLIGTLVTIKCVPIGLVLRNQRYKAGWQQNAVTPRAYLQANMILFASLTAPVLIHCLLMWITARPWGHLVWIAASIALHALNFPKADPMQPTEPRLEA